MSLFHRTRTLAFGLLLLASLRAVSALAAAPAFHVVELGAGAPIDVTSGGTVVGIAGTSASPQPWIVRDGTRSNLPLPAGATYAMVNRVSAAGVAVGHVSGKPVIWLPAPGGYTVTMLPLPVGASGGVPTAVIDTPDGPRVVLNVGTPGFLSSPTVVYFSASAPFLVEPGGELVDLAARYSPGASFSVVDMTPSGRILAGNGAILEPDGRTTAAPPGRTTSWTGFAVTRFNERGEMVAIASLATSDGHGEIARYSPASGWFVIETFIGAMYPYSADGINDAGDALSSQYGGHMLTTADGQRLPLNGLLLEPGYVLTTAPGGAMSDDGRIASVARNPAGTWTAVRLDPAGPLPPPAAVTLSAIAHPATAAAPWNAISLTWTASAKASAYVVERKGPGDAGFVALTPASGTIQLIYDDTSVAASTTYTYRVIPVGAGGNGAPSNEVTVLAPPPMDTTAPTARITSPTAGAVVSGPVTVSAEAADNVGLRGLEIRYQPNQGSEVLCAKSYAIAPQSDTLSCTWDPRYLPTGTTAQLTAFAYDELGNYVMSPISVTYRTGSTVTDKTAPVVKVLAPADGATVSGTVQVQASATDNVGVVRMEIRNAAGVTLARIDAAAIAYQWDTSRLRAGSRQTLTVRAYDKAGNVGNAKIAVRIAR